MQVYDIIILILVGWLTLRGAMKGMVSQLASIAAVIASFWAATRFGPVLEPIVKSALKVESPWDKVLGITLAFVGASVAVMFLHRILANLISVIRMQKYDRLCGALFGFLKGVLIGMILTFFAVMLSEQTRVLATQSRSGAILVRLIQRTQALLPDDVSALIESNLEGFCKQLESGTETADETISKEKSVSSAVTGMKNAFVTMQSFVTPLFKQTMESDLADTQPSLSSATQKNDASSIRDYTEPQLPQYGASYPSYSGNAEAGSQNEPRMAAIEPANAATSPPVGTTPTSGSLTSLPAMPVVTPSTDLMPITATTATPTLPNGETDWRTLLRNLR